MVKFKIKFGVVPVIVALAWPPGSPVVTLPIVKEGDWPIGPVGPVVPCKPCGPVGPVGPVAPRGITKSKTTFWLVPPLMTLALEPGSDVVVDLTLIVAGPRGPVGPWM